MPARVTVWCRRAVDGDVEALYAHLGGVDWLTLGETAELDDAVVEEALAGLALGGEGLDGLEVRWSDGARPLQVQRLAGEMLTEARSEQEDAPEAAAATVSSAVEAWDLELGWTSAEGFGGVLAHVLAFWIAERGDGVVDFYGQEWYSPADRGRPLG